MENEYDNKKLKKYFEANIRRMEINKEFKPLLVDIMMRRAIAFNLSLQEIYRDMLVLANNLTKIEVGQIPDDYEGNVTGLYYSNERKILISQEIVKKIIISENMENYEEVYDTLMHEVFHALAMDENGNNTISTINRYTNEVYTSLEEAIVSKAVDRCMHGRRVKEEENFPFFHQNKGAYTDITYITDLLEATYGVSEKAFLRHAIQGKKNLAEFLSSVSGESIDESLGYIDKIETNYSILHKTLYESGFEGKELEDRVKDSLIAGFLVSYWTMYRCIENLDVSDLDTFGYRIERFKFGYNKMGELLRHVTKDFDYRFRNNNVSSYIFDLIKGTQEEGGLKLNIISEILKNKEKIPNEDLVKMLNFAKMERKEKKAFEEEELFEKYGISASLNKDNKIIISHYSQPKNTTFVELGINEDELIKDVVACSGVFDTRKSSLTTFPLEVSQEIRLYEDTAILEMPNLKAAGKIVLNSKLKKLPKLKAVGSIALENSQIKALPKLKEAGILIAQNSALKDLSELKSAKDVFICSSDENQKIDLKAMKNLKEVEQLFVANSSLKALPSLKKASKVALYNCSIKSIKDSVCKNVEIATQITDSELSEKFDTFTDWYNSDVFQKSMDILGDIVNQIQGKNK